MKSGNRKLLALFSGIALIVTGCDQDKFSQSQPEQVTLQERLLPYPNPTSYEFDASISGVTNAIRKAYGMDWYLAEAKKNHEKVWEGNGDATTKRLFTLALQQPPESLFFRGDADALAKRILIKPGNENDAYLYGGNSPAGQSQVYFKDGYPLIYYADFHIHLTAVGPKKTRVEVFTHDSSVVTGVDKSWSPHGPAFISVSVKPTTIEEYQILLGIGAQLGTKGMPPLVLPNSNAPLKDVVLPRAR